MLTKRIIPCLDVQNGRTVKGINFLSLRDAGDPVELAAAYSAAGADELVFLDITATHEGRKTLRDLVRKVAQAINIPFTVGGGVGSVADVSDLLSAGADKIAVNSAAVTRPELLTELSREFGTQCIVLAVDARRDTKNPDKWEVCISGGRKPTGKDLFDWCREGQDRGAGEILFTSMEHDGTKTGFALKPLARLSSSLLIPVIASGGSGKMRDFADAFQIGMADAALAASVFHFGEILIPDLKAFLHTAGIPIRI